ncbi:MAG: hypothetical protein COA53_01980 [Rhodobacteraceae bacterium]|nr:MAG: hypothetical protein COA53_01980 [Paracoccaceae bacterium]
MATTVPIYILMVLPAVLGLVFVGFGVLYAGGLRPVVFELSWLTFAFVLIGTSIASNAPVLEEAKHLSRAYLAVFVAFASISAYTTIAVAPSVKMASYATGTSIAAILTGLAASALLRRYGDGILMRVSWALFLAMLLQAPFWIWLYVTEGQNSEFDWNNRTPGFPSVRMYGYSVEAGLAAALGLFYLSDNKSKLIRTSLIVGTISLWMLLFWSGGRGALLALLATCIVVAIITPKFVTKMWKFLIATIAVGAGLSLLLPVPSGAYGLLRRFNATANTGTLNDISSDRITLWSDAYSIFLDRPIFGHGMLQYSHVTTLIRADAPIQVHNIILESLVAFGLVGTVALAFLLGKIWVSAAIRLHRGDNLSTLPVFLIATSLLVHGLVSGTYYHIHSVLIIAISLGLLLYDHDNPSDVSKGSDDDS